MRGELSWRYLLEKIIIGGSAGGHGGVDDLGGLDGRRDSQKLFSQEPNRNPSLGKLVGLGRSGWQFGSGIGKTAGLEMTTFGQKRPSLGQKGL